MRSEAWEGGEQVLFEERGVLVSTRRFVVRQQTYPLGGITSIRSVHDKPSRAGPYLVGLVGIMGVVAGPETMVLGVILLGIALAWGFTQHSTSHVILTSAAGETAAITSRDHEYVRRVADALNKAIVSRS